MGSDLNICSKGHPTSPSVGTLMHPVSRILPMMKPCYNHYGMAPLPYGLGCVADRSDSASALSGKTFGSKSTMQWKVVSYTGRQDDSCGSATASGSTMYIP
jgi:hypothetical protein